MFNVHSQECDIIAMYMTTYDTVQQHMRIKHIIEYDNPLAEWVSTKHIGSLNWWVVESIRINRKIASMDYIL